MRWAKSIFGFVLCGLLIMVSGNASVNVTEESYTDTIIFPEDQVIEVNITLDEADYQSMLDNATAEQYIPGEITYNGYTFTGIGIRPKGNSSLRDVANSDSDRYSYKIDFNEYLDGQDFFGITKINLNNLFSDPSMMAEYIGYDMLRSIGADVPRTCYIKFSINGEYAGLYLAVEEINSAFLEDHYGNSSGDLYKPAEATDYDANDFLAEGPIEETMNVDSFLMYLAASTLTVHLDSYQGGMDHNYYMYDNNGFMEWITWDLNMIFNGFPGSGMTDTEAMNFLIDEPVKGSMENYPLVQAVFENEEYIEQYHEYLEILITEYGTDENFTEKVTEVYNLINQYVKTDPSAFYTYEEFLDGVFSEEGGLTSPGILSFMSARVDNIASQLSGDIPSTNNGEGNIVANAGGGRSGGLPPEMLGEGVTEMTGERQMPPEGVDGTMDGMGPPPQAMDGSTEDMGFPPQAMDVSTEEMGAPPEAMDGSTEEMGAPPEAMDGSTEEMGSRPEAMDGSTEGMGGRPEAMDGSSEGMGGRPEAMDGMELNAQSEDLTQTTSLWPQFIFLAVAIFLMAGSILYFSVFKKF